MSLGYVILYNCLLLVKTCPLALWVGLVFPLEKAIKFPLLV